MTLYESYYGIAPLGTEETIQHYGRLGMKWGQHIYGKQKGAERYVAKGEKKLTKLKSRKQSISLAVTKQNAKTTKAKEKAANDLLKARTPEDLQNSKKVRKYMTLNAKLARMQAQEASAQLKVEKLETKVNQFRAEMEAMSKQNKRKRSKR